SGTGLERGEGTRRKLGRMLRDNSSPSAMRNHTKSAHPEQLPEGVSHSRQGQVDKPGLPKQVDATLMREWSTNIVLGALQPVRLISDACVRTVICKYVQGVGGKTRLQAEVDENTADIQVEVKEVLARAKAEGCRFVISGDTWKPKMRRRAHYLAIYINWCSAEWEHKTVCLSANPLPAPRTGEAYQQAFAAALAGAGLELSDLVCSLSDHEGAIRKGLRDLGPASVGCGTHAFQLCPKHGLPPLREKNQGAPAAASDESSDSDSSSSSSSSSDPAAAPAAAGAPAAAAAGDPAAAAAGAPAAPPRKRGRKKDPDHLTMQSELARPFKQFRSTVKWYVNNDDAYSAMEADCKAEELPFMAYVSETPSRRSSGLDCAVSVLRNNHGHAFSRARHSTKAPTELSPDEALEGLHLCAVLTPVKRGTKLLEGDGDKALASMYLPVWHAVSQALNPRVTKELPIPKVLTAKFGEKVKVQDLKTKAKKLLLFLHNDLIKIKNKHLMGTSGEKLLRVCSYLDPRFKGHGYATHEQLQEARACLKQLDEHVAKQMQELDSGIATFFSQMEQQILAALQALNAKADAADLTLRAQAEAQHKVSAALQAQQARILQMLVDQQSAQAAVASAQADALALPRGSQGTTSTGLVTAKCDYRISKFFLPVSVEHSLDRSAGTVRFDLDENKSRLVLQEASGYWFVEQSPDGPPNTSRVWLCVQSLRASALVPWSIVDYAAERALRRATCWLKPVMEERWKKEQRLRQLVTQSPFRWKTSRSSEAAGAITACAETTQHEQTTRFSAPRRLRTA
ncbi:unnamed protein product, partial [Polarella glacialis]